MFLYTFIFNLICHISVLLCLFVNKFNQVKNELTIGYSVSFFYLAYTIFF